MISENWESYGPWTVTVLLKKKKRKEKEKKNPGSSGNIIKDCTDIIAYMCAHLLKTLEKCPRRKPCTTNAFTATLQSIVVIRWAFRYSFGSLQLLLFPQGWWEAAWDAQKNGWIDNLGSVKYSKLHLLQVAFEPYSASVMPEHMRLEPDPHSHLYQLAPLEARLLPLIRNFFFFSLGFFLCWNVWIFNFAPFRSMCPDFSRFRNSKVNSVTKWRNIMVTLSGPVTFAFSCCVFHLAIPLYKFAMDQCLNKSK